MAQNITLMGASYSAVPAVTLPKTGGGTATFTDTSDATLNNGNKMLSGNTAYSNGTKYTGSITSKSAQTYTPTTTNQTIASGQYLSGAQTIKGDANLLAENIKKDVSIFSVVGSYEGGGGGVGEVTFEGTLAITSTTNLWQYVDDDPETSAYIITLRDLYVNNHYMNYMSEWTLFSDVGQAIDMPLFIHVRDENDDYDYDIYLQMYPASQETYIYGGSSLRANVKKIVKVAM